MHSDNGTNTAHSDKDSGYVKSADMLIGQFNIADFALKKALAAENDTLISIWQEKADFLIEEMIAFDSESITEKRLIFQFLLDRFVCQNQPKNGLVRKICDRLISIY